MNQEIKKFLYSKYKNIVEEKDGAGFTVALYNVDEYDAINFPGLLLTQYPSTIKLASKGAINRGKWVYFIVDNYYYESDSLRRIKLLAFI